MSAMPMTQNAVNANIGSAALGEAGAIYVDLPSAEPSDLQETAQLAHSYLNQQAMANIE